jgi:hypothetical protein
MEKFFNTLLEMVQSGATFIQGQLPDYVNQLLLFVFWQRITGILIWTIILMVMIITLFITLKLIKKNKIKDLDEKPAYVASLILCGFTALVLLMTGVLCVPEAISDLIKIKVAPKVFVVDYLREMIKK